MIKIYPLEWLDTLILQILNPKMNNLRVISEADLTQMAHDVLEEAKKAQVQIRNETFTIRKEEQLRLLVGQYQATFICLMDQMVENQKDEVFKNRGLAHIAQTVLHSLEVLLSFVETRFSNFVNLDQGVAPPYMIMSKKEFELKMDQVNAKENLSSSDKKTLTIVMRHLSEVFENSCGAKRTYRELLYVEEVVKKMEGFCFTTEDETIYTAFDQMLIEVNFNATEYVQDLTQRIACSLNLISILFKRRSALLLYFKEFKQLHTSTKVGFDANQISVKELIFNWFEHEMDYLQSKIDLLTEDSPELKKKKVEHKALSSEKIECSLSTDQLGIMLRAVAEAQVVTVKSKSQIFRAVGPYLSTPQRKDLSYESMRTKSYDVEERDKEVVIKILELITSYVKSY